MSDPQARLTNIGLQAEVKEKPKVRLTNIGLQVDVFDDPAEVRITNFALQVEVGEYYLVAEPIRTRPRAAAARVLPRSPASRTGTEPPYGRA
jgi:hypothetical protein